MASVAAPVAPTNGRDELDRIIDYEDTVQDFMKDLPLPENPNVGANGGPQRETRDEDQEIQIKRKRNPIPKLDEDRLLSDAGIPKLRKIAKTRLKFRGKGHEFSDMSRLLNTYQIWLDDLYPRAKFRDALTMVEKVGHSKRMQITRRAWLDETKPFRKEPSPDPTLSNSNGPEASRGDVGDEDLFAEMMAENNAEQGSRPNDSTGDANPSAVSAAPRESSQNNDEPDEDELDQLLAEQSNTGEVQSRPTQARRGPFMDDTEDEEDDLDALLAEQGQVPTAMPSRPSTSKPQQHDDFAAEEEAMAGMEDMW